MLVMAGGRCAGTSAHLTAMSSSAAAVRSLGTSDFPAAFAHMMASDFLADQTIVFRADAPGRIRTLIAQNLLEGAGQALKLADSYTSRHWTNDPRRQLLSPTGPSAPPDVTLCVLKSEDIGNREYRLRLFSEPRLLTKAALVFRTADYALSVNLYRSMDRPHFADGELQAIEQACDVIAALLERHFTLLHDKAGCNLDAVQEVIASAARERGAVLSLREQAVCTRIVMGCTTEGIGLDLQVSSHSVVSYRRRAYEKLGIATQKELFQIVLNRHRLLGNCPPAAEAIKPQREE